MTYDITENLYLLGEVQFSIYFLKKKDTKNEDSKKNKRMIRRNDHAGQKTFNVRTALFR